MAGYDGGPLLIFDGKMYVRGSLDKKGTLATMMVAVRVIARGMLCGDVILAYVDAVEYGSSSTEEAPEVFAAEAATFTKSSHLEVTLAHEVQRLGQAPVGALISRITVQPQMFYRRRTSPRWQAERAVPRWCITATATLDAHPKCW